MIDMGALLSYSIYSAIVMALLYLTYKWMLAGENRHRANRVTLLSIYAVSMSAFPIMSWLSGVASDASGQTPGLTVEVDMPVVAGVDMHGNAIADVALWIYLVGVIAVTVHTVVTWLRLASIVSRGRHVKVGRYTLVLTGRKDIAPFSWHKYIVMNEDDYADGGDIILCHETRHLDLRHPLDLLVAQIVAIVEWWNPAAWLMREELKAVHEYQADSCVLAAGVDARAYQMLLIKKAVGARFPSLANSLNHSKLKKRITMMYNQKKSAKRGMRVLALLPALGAAVLVANLPAVASVLSETSCAALMSPDAPPVAYGDKVTKTSEKPGDGDVIYENPETLPEYPGGMMAMLDYLAANLQYPEGHEDTQGRVVVKFVVKKDGNVGDVQVIKSLGEPFDNEAVRVVKSMPRFTPGMSGGHAVDVYYTLPVNFKAAPSADVSDKRSTPSAKTVAIKSASKKNAPSDREVKMSSASLPSNAVIKINGEEVTSSELASLPASSIASMTVDKSSGDRPVILIFTK